MYMSLHPLDKNHKFKHIHKFNNQNLKKLTLNEV